MAETQVTCPHCGEVQSSDNYLCSRCGNSTETKEQRKVRLDALEQSRRAAERSDVSIQRLPGFGTNGVRRTSLAQMSNQRRRRFIVVIAVLAIAIAFCIRGL
jgi:DNA-directed RNA polymerase subunit RPC12/RpoP